VVGWGFNRFKGGVRNPTLAYTPPLSTRARGGGWGGGIYSQAVVLRRAVILTSSLAGWGKSPELFFPRYESMITNTVTAVRVLIHWIVAWMI